jgi:hypothetical protein
MWGQGQDPDLEQSHVEESYFDDPEIITKQPIDRRLKALSLILVLFVSSFFIRTSLASNISLNSQTARDFGQGISQTVACSGTTALTIKPTATFVNASGNSAAHYLSSITVSNIPSNCYLQTFLLKAFGDSSSNPLSIFNSTSTIASIFDNSGTFVVGANMTGATVVTNSSSSFTVTFTNPVALTKDVAKITIETTNAPPLFNYESIQFTSAGYARLNTGLSFGSGAFTIETWFKTGSSIHGGDILGNDATSGGLSFILDNSTMMHTDGFNQSATNFTLPITLQPNTWYHFALARDGSSNETVWVNGQRSTSGVQSDSRNYYGTASGINWAHCNWCVAGSSVFDGERIASYRIVIGSTVYDPNTATFTPPAAPLGLVPNTKLLLLAKSAGAFLNDEGGNQTLTNYGTTFTSGQ